MVVSVSLLRAYLDELGVAYRIRRPFQRIVSPNPYRAREFYPCTPPADATDEIVTQGGVVLTFEDLRLERMLLGVEDPPKRDDAICAAPQP